MRLTPALALMLWAGVAQAQVVLEVPEETPPGYPPFLGAISGTLGTEAVAWEFFDFSIGAFDASAWVERDYDGKDVELHLFGYPPGQPEDRRFRVYVEGLFGKSLAPGVAVAPLVEIYRGADREGPRLTSNGQRAEVVIDSIGPRQENSYLRHITGTVRARLCPKGWLLKSCQDIDLRFDTEVQMGSAVPVKE